jgi:tRNA threonylcarbamoyladenosine biosynthesis protein TsaE
VTAPATVRLRTAEPDATRAAGAAVADVLQPGDVVSLTGELGAGKTCFVQGAADRLGVTRRVTSPTFVIVKTYPEARVPIVHVDVYRLNRLQDVLDLGDEVFAPDAITFIEWGDAVARLLPEDHLEIELVHDDGESAGTARRIALHARGRFATRVPALTSGCAAWIEDR